MAILEWLEGLIFRFRHKGGLDTTRFKRNNPFMALVDFPYAQNEFITLYGRRYVIYYIPARPSEMSNPVRDDRQ